MKMKRNTFILFSIYLFVLQAIFVWLLRWDYKFFCLAGINTFFISIIGYFTRNTDNLQKDFSRIEENQVFSEKVHYIQKKSHNKKTVHHFWFFIVAVLCGFFAWFWMPTMDVFLQIFFATLVSFFVFAIFCSLFKFKPFRVWESKLFFVVLFLSLLWYVLWYFKIDVLDFNKSTNLDVSWDVILSWYIANSFVSVDADLNENEISPIVEVEETSDLDLAKNATFDDVIKYLLDKNTITLSTDKSIKFNYISNNHKDYPYYRTAYWLRMIGKNINPSKSLLCETYVVMQWLVENWNVPSYSDIKQAYWNYAKNNDKLPSCSYWKFLTLADIK